MLNDSRRIINRLLVLKSFQGNGETKFQVSNKTKTKKQDFKWFLENRTPG